MKTKKTVLFDLDGTLFDTKEGIFESIAYTNRQLKISAPSLEEMKKFIGPPIQDTYQAYYGFDAERARCAAGIFREYYKEKALYKAKLYDGIEELLFRLKKEDWTIGIATYKREDYAIKLVSHFGVDTKCDVVHGSDMQGRLTKKDIIRLCIEELQTESSSVVYIGDTYGDYKAATDLGIRFIAVTYGFGFQRGETIDGKGVVGVADTPDQIFKILTADDSAE